MLVVSAIFFLTALFLCGYACLDAVDRSGGCDEADRLALAFPAGLASVGAALYTLNVVGVPFGRPLVLLTLAAGSALGAARLRSRRWTPAGALSPLRDLPAGGGPLGLISVIVVLFLVAGFAALCLMHVDLQGDTRSQHFSYPAILLRTGWQPAYATLSGGESFNVTPALLVTYAAYWSSVGRIEQVGPNLLPLLLLIPWGLLGLLALRRAFW
ncbi:MAG: hypothetical protein LC772_12525, partial [Chloroflexi bacterium]|nr:hypothetical protein [Chloroflexota bacterium]